MGRTTIIYMLHSHEACITTIFNSLVNFFLRVHIVHVFLHVLLAALHAEFGIPHIVCDFNGTRTGIPFIWNAVSQRSW